MANISGIFRIGNDPQLKHTASGDYVISLSLAYNYGMKPQDGNRPTQWLDASLWGKRAEALAQYLTKGSQIYAVISDPHIEEYQKRDGTAGVKIAGRIDAIEFASSPSAAPAPRQAPAPARQYKDDIPF